MSTAGYVTFAPIVAESAVKHAANASKDDASQRQVSAVRETAFEVEASLVRALERASAPGQWDAVKLIADELRARRLVRDGVPELQTARRAHR